VCRGVLTGAPEQLSCSNCGAEYGAIGGVPLLVPDADVAAIDLRGDAHALPGHDAAAIGIPAIDEALARGDLMLELGAGRETTTAPNVVRTDAFVFTAEHLDVVADAHALPFPDGSFDFVFSLAVFEHLHSPWLAAAEVARVLRPGGRAFTLCAFLQPLHGYPDHYFNATESGLRRLFSDDFQVESCGPSRHSSHRESAVPLYRMREMAEAYRRTGRADMRTRWRRRRLERALATASHQFQQLADRMLASPGAYEAWRHIAPSVELLARRR
jgi:ubiquinone/menaquinone biosynthesis C-methylase UbiE